jgi:hypothetical protein
MKSSFIKSISNLVGAVCAFGIVLGIKLIASNDYIYLLGALVLIMAPIVVFMIVYFMKKSHERAKFSTFMKSSVREGVKSTYNSVLILYVAFDLFFNYLGYLSATTEGHYESLPFEVANQINLNNPIQSSVFSIGFLLLAYISFNTFFNYMSSDSEKHAKALKEK